MSEYADIAVAPESGAEDEEATHQHAHDDSQSTSDRRSTKSSSGLTKKKSARGSRRGSAMRSASAVSFSAEDEAARERSHLIDSNKKLRAQVRTLKGQLRNLREQRDGPISAGEQKQIQLLREQNADYEVEIDELRARAAIASDVGTLDSLMDEVQEKEIQLKALELERRNLADNGRACAKLLNHNEAMPSRQKVFLDLKEERRHHKKRMRNLQLQIERTRNYTKEVEKRAEDLEKTVRDRGLHEVTIVHVKELREKDKEQKKQLGVLQRQLHILNGTFEAQRTHTQWVAKDREIEVERLREAARSLEQAIINKEKIIMSNLGLVERPTHFVKPLGDDEIPPLPPRSPSRSPRKQAPHKRRKEPQPREDAVVQPRPPKAAAGAAKRPQHHSKPPGAAGGSVAAGGKDAGKGKAPKRAAGTKTLPSAKEATANAAKRQQQDEEEAQLPSPRKPTPPEEAEVGQPVARRPTPPSSNSASTASRRSPEDEDDRLNDIDSPRRTPTPPPSPPKGGIVDDDTDDDNDDGGKGGAPSGNAVGDDAAYAEDEFVDDEGSPQRDAAPTAARADDDDDAYAEDEFVGDDEEGRKNVEETTGDEVVEEPAFLTD